MEKNGLEKVMGDKRTSVIMAVIGVLTVGGMIVYQSEGDLDPMIIFGIISSFVMCAIMVYFILYYKK